MRSKPDDWETLEMLRHWKHPKGRLGEDAQKQGVYMKYVLESIVTPGFILN